MPFSLGRLFRIQVLAIVFATAIIVFAEVLVGKGHRLADAVCVLAALLAMLFFRTAYQRISPNPHRTTAWWRPIGSALIFLLFAWVFASAADIWLRPTSTFKPRSSASSDSNRLPSRVAVSLSGGGYRAALFHAGVLNELDQLGVRIQAVSSVSGGSIIGSFYAVGGRP